MKPALRIRVYRSSHLFRVRPFTVSVGGFILVNEFGDPRTFKTRSSAANAGVKALAAGDFRKVKVKRLLGGRPANI